ncbi:MAG: TonB-dependent receptor [Kiritimatiellaeota bacterium]|nr:TonB-dependent receptor [Kiritimatiellota bacterium]
MQYASTQGRAPALWAACALTIPCLAQVETDTPKPEHVADLPPIVVEASRMGQGAEDLPVGVTVITADQIRRSGAADTVQALERLGGLHVRKVNGSPMQAEVVMRGFSQNAHGRVLVLVDGQRLNQPDMQAPNWSRVPVEAVERIEILHGGQTALYGDYAVAGVINVITKKGGEPRTAVTVTGGSEETFGAHLRTSGSLGEDTRYSADADWQRGRGWRENARYEVFDARAEVGHDWTERFASSVGGFYNFGGYGMPGPLSRQQMRDDPRQSVTPDDRATGDSWGLRFGAKGETLDWGTFSMDALWQRTTRDAKFWSWGSHDAFTLSSLMLTPKYQLDADIAGRRNTLIFGADIAFDWLDYNKSDLPGGAMMSDAKLERQSAALYAHDTFYILETLALAAGARGEVMRTTAEGRGAWYDYSTWSSRVSPFDGGKTDWQQAFDAALLFRPAKGQKYYVRGATLFRYPFADEIANYQGYSQPGMNTDLDPEYGWQLEAGLSLELFDALTYDLRGYLLEMRDEIAWGNGRNVNLDKTRRWGLETGLRWSPEPWGALGIMYQLVDAEFAAGANKGKLVPLVPAQVITVDAEASIAYGVSVFGATRVCGRQYLGDDNANLGGKIPGYATFDVGVRYSPAFLEGFSLTASCDNVFDKTYATTGFWGWGGADSFYPANGRTWRLAATYAF